MVESNRVRGNTLLINRGNGEFDGEADAHGVRNGGWGWATSFTDFTNDGRLDLVQATQHVIRIDPDDPRWTYPMVWRGQADNSSFARVNQTTHGLGEHDTRGIATLDYDRDGDRDLVMATYSGPLVLYGNTVAAGNSVQFEVIGKEARRRSVRPSLSRPATAAERSSRPTRTISSRRRRQSDTSAWARPTRRR